MSSDITVEKTLWGQAPNGEPVHCFTLSAPDGAEVALSELGGTLLHWLAPDRERRMANIVLGFDTPQAYLGSGTHMGGSIGRWANRIANARFDLDGRTYQLEANDGPNSLHGGSHGFDRLIWQAEAIDGGVRLQHISLDGEEGFPGRLDVQIDYRFERIVKQSGATEYTPEAEKRQASPFDTEYALRIDYTARTDAPTPVNLTNHAYFNLAATGTTLDHMIEIHADRVLLTDANNIPHTVANVTGSALDFRKAASIRERLESGDPAIRAAHGIDHCFALGDPTQRHVPLREVATARDQASGRCLSVSTTERGIQFYTGANLEGVVGKAGIRHHSHDAFCFETQAWPDQINGEYAEAVILRPGQVYRQTTVYTASVCRLF